MTIDCQHCNEDHVSVGDIHGNGKRVQPVLRVHGCHSWNGCHRVSEPVSAEHMSCDSLNRTNAVACLFVVRVGPNYSCPSPSARLSCLRADVCLCKMHLFSV